MIQAKKTSPEAGFTIVELLVTIIVGAVMVTGLNAIVSSHAYLTHRSKNLILANAFVESKVETLRSTGFLSLANGTTDISSELPAELTSPRSASLEVSSYSTSVKQVNISITYNDQGFTRTYTYTTHIGELGVGQY